MTCESECVVGFVSEKNHFTCMMNMESEGEYHRKMWLVFIVCIFSPDVLL